MFSMDTSAAFIHRSKFNRAIISRQSLTVRIKPLRAAFFSAWTINLPMELFMTSGHLANDLMENILLSISILVPWQDRMCDSYLLFFPWDQPPAIARSGWNRELC